MRLEKERQHRSREEKKEREGARPWSKDEGCAHLYVAGQGAAAPWYRREEKPWVRSSGERPRAAYVDMKIRLEGKQRHRGIRKNKEEESELSSLEEDTWDAYMCMTVRMGMKQ